MILLSAFWEVFLFGIIIDYFYEKTANERRNGYEDVYTN